MYRVSKWLDRTLHLSSSSQSLDALAESRNLLAALKAVDLIMEDNMDGAETLLSEGNSAFHLLCKGVIGFVKATLGFEQDIMKEASDKLSAAEDSAYNDHYRAQHDTNAFHSNIYERGAEFSLCQAMAQIMIAVVGVLNESLTEAIRGFYKLRKAYWTLDSLTQMEHATVKARNARSISSSRPHTPDSAKSAQSTTVDSVLQQKLNPKGQDVSQALQPSSLHQADSQHTQGDADSEDSDDFYDVNEIRDENEITKTYTGKLETEADMTLTQNILDPSETAVEKLSALSLSHPIRPGSSGSLRETSADSNNLLTADPDDPIFDSPVDVFIHSGTNFCFGLISLLISMVPPAFSKLLYIIGFRGDRNRGMRMLWQASKFANINGALAGLIILGWYNGIVGLWDIIPDPDEDGIEGYPFERLQNLLAQMRHRYPKSHFWLIEEARMAAAGRNLERCVALLSEPRPKSQLKQLQALHMFEKAMASMHTHKYQQCADSFLACVDLNSWSQALYYYIAASAHLQIYRDSKHTADAKEAGEAKKHGKLAEEYFRTAATKIGRKKVMGRQLPFDVFVARKIAKWTARMEAWGCTFVEAIGVSPVEEMIMLWNGYKKMNRDQLEHSLHNLAWSESDLNKSFWEREEGDEKAILALLRANVYTYQGDYERSKELLQRNILALDPHLLKGGQRDDWVAPSAHFQMAVNLWMQRSGYVRVHGRQTTERSVLVDVDVEKDRRLVALAKGYVEKVRGWEKYELDARIGMKITAAWDAIKKWEAKHGVANVPGRK